MKPVMDRRSFIGTLTGGLLAAPLGVEAQLAGKVWRIGYLDQGSAAPGRSYVDGLRQGLRDLGWVEGRNIVVDVRFAEGKTDQLPRLAAELVNPKTAKTLGLTIPPSLLQRADYVIE
jgi:hypothetical protein